MTAILSLARPVGESVDSPATARLLLAEDNPIASDLIAMMARRLGYDLDRVPNGLDAVDAVARAAALGQPYSLILLDAMMPVLDGAEAARRMRANGMTAEMLPIIAVTAATDPAEVREYLAAGMQGYLAKPVSLADFSACIDAWVPQLVRAPQRGKAAPEAALRRRYELRKTEVLERFEAASLAATTSPEQAAELREHLHKLAGTAGSFGEKQLSKAAAKGEALLTGATPAELQAAVRRSYALLRSVG